MTKAFFSICTLLTALSVHSADVVGAMRPNADLTVYFDTMQAERAMSPEIWKRIQSDKKKAASRSKGKSAFNTIDRDIVGCVNVDFPGFDPFRFRLDGLLTVSGGKNASSKNDVGDFAAAFREMGYEVTEGGDKRKPSCKVNMAANAPLPHSGAELVSEDDNTLRVTARWGMNEQDAAAAFNGGARLAGLLSSHSASGTSLVLVGDAKKLSNLPLDGSAEQRALKQLLMKLDTFRIDVTARGDVLVVRAFLRFLNEKDAAAYRKSAQEGVAAFIGGNNSAMLRKMASDGEGLDMNVTIDVDINAAWSFLGRFEQDGVQKKGK